MPTRKKKEETDNRLIVEDFYKRWNIDLSNEERWTNFRDRVLNSYASKIGFEFLQNTKCEDQFFNLVGVHNKITNAAYEIDFLLTKKLIESPTYKYLLEERDMRKFLLGIEVVFWMESIEWYKKYDFLEELKDAIVITAVPLVLTETDNEILFYPAGAKLLDEKLVSDNLDWLEGSRKVVSLLKLH